jgi:hypothetical protein
MPLTASTTSRFNKKVEGFAMADQDKQTPKAKKVKTFKADAITSVSGEVIDRIIHRVQSVAKIRYNGDEVGHIVQRIFQYIDLFNTIKEYDHQLFDHKELESIDVLKEFSPFIIPRSVKLIVDNRARDVLKHTDLADVMKDLSFDDYMDVCNRFRAFMKLDALSNTVKLSELKTNLDLTQHLDKLAFSVNGDYLCHDYDDKCYIPYQVNWDVTPLFKPGYFNNSRDDVIERFVESFNPLNQG